MDELVRLIGSLPMPALLVFAAVLALIFGVRHMGLLQGLRALAPAEGAGEGTGRILGAVIDNKKADELIAAFTKVASELADNTEATKETGNAIRANTAAAISMGGDITDARTDIRELTREIVRSGR
ncbi:hypothetical protein [Devosia submarina]|uniref:hypothetical protein n=1 Tax=Devosia submarina TaxID=1173082 RepID=UPI00130072AF|nr:hypothetical protein [Devosia submarina]